MFRCPAGVSVSEPQDIPRLTGKRRAFADAYLGACRFNATRAAEAAGYASPAVEGSRLLRIAKVATYIEFHLSQAALSRDQVLALVRDDALRSDEDILALAERAPGVPAKASTISSLLSARTTARTNLLKASGALTDKISVRHSGRVDHVHRIPEGLRNLTDDELDKLEELAERVRARGEV